MKHLTFLSDFGLKDEWVAACRGVVWKLAPDAVINDITHEIPPFDVRKGAFVLAAAILYCPLGVHLAVVDPGVGTSRRGVALKVVRGDYLLGPDNGLLIPAAKALGGIVGARVLEPAGAASPAFHGRDLFAPAAARLLRGTAFEALGSAIYPESLTPSPWGEAAIEADRISAEVIDVDRFGTVRLNAKPALIGEIGASLSDVLRLSWRESSIAVPFVWTFGDVQEGAPLLFSDSSGFLAIAVNRGNASLKLGLRSGDRVAIGPL